MNFLKHLLLLVIGSILAVIGGLFVLDTEYKYYNNETSPTSNINYLYQQSDHQKFKPNFDSYVYIFQKDSANKIYKFQ